MTRKPDTLSTVLLIGGLALAIAVAFAMPALHFRGADKALLGISAWEAVPWATKLKLAFLAAAAAVAFLPRLGALRAPVLAGAAAMMFLPAIAAFTAGVLQWTTVRAEIVALSGTRAPWIDPGWGVVVLVAAAMMVVGALIRMGRSEAPAAGAA